ncbi:MAG TPA: (2Fe-2S) ferredoxin domain-containing protein, partial [Bacillota bacterium]|nr:(2Fe-2S) ferredoxin domain-containing protein [Bacillota bacterium]
MSTATVAEQYRALRQEAAAAVEALKQKPVVWVGTATCGVAAGALKIKEAFEQEIKERGLDVAVLETGCMGHCYAEPMAIIAKPGHVPLCYGRLDEGLVHRLVVDFLDGDDPGYEYAL